YTVDAGHDGGRQLSRRRRGCRVEGPLLERGIGLGTGHGRAVDPELRVERDVFGAQSRDGVVPDVGEQVALTPARAQLRVDEYPVVRVVRWPSRAIHVVGRSERAIRSCDLLGGGVVGVLDWWLSCRVNAKFVERDQPIWVGVRLVDVE